MSTGTVAQVTLTTETTFTVSFGTHTNLYAKLNMLATIVKLGHMCEKTL